MVIKAVIACHSQHNYSQQADAQSGKNDFFIPQPPITGAAYLLEQVGLRRQIGFLLYLSGETPTK